MAGIPCVSHAEFYKTRRTLPIPRKWTETLTDVISGALMAAAAETPSSFQNPIFLVVWLIVGFVGLVFGVIASSLARRRMRDQVPARRDVRPLSPLQVELLNAA